MRARACLLVAAIVLTSSGGASGAFAPTGVGGGGWLHGGAFHPTDTDVILVGADVSGVYRTDDFGLSWRPWNAGLPNHDESYSQYVDDLLGIEYNGTVYFYAATYGGIFRAPDSGGWVAQTPPTTVAYRNSSSSSYHADAIPFCCLDDDGSYLVAGAGQSRYGSTSYETTKYPGLPSGSCETWGVGGQYTVWSCDLTGGTDWTPDTATEFGAARDISVASIGGQRYIAVAAHDGIHLKKPGQAWLRFNTVLEDSLDCWSIHLTTRGTLYAAFQRAGYTNRPTGVYRIFDVTTADANTPFTLVGDATQLQPSAQTILDYGRAGDLMFLTVSDGTGTGEEATPDRLFLASRTWSQGTFRGNQPYSAQGVCSWEHMTWYGNPAPYHWFWDFTLNPPAPAVMDPGWTPFPWSDIIFHPVVSRANPDCALIHNNARIHVTANGGDSWLQRYVTGSTSGWTSRGYNELCVEGLDFMSDGRIVEGTGDCGTFLATDATNVAFQCITPVVNIYTSATSNEAWNQEAGRVHVRVNWNGGGDAIFVVIGDMVQKNQPAKLFMYRSGVWTNITGGIPDLDHHLFGDFTFGNDNTCYLIYTKFNDRVGYSGVRPLETGVYKGVYSSGVWTWSTLNTGLSDTEVDFNRFGDQIAYNAYANRVMLACGFRNGYLYGSGDQTVVTHGGLFYLDGLSDTSWSACFDGHSGDFRDFRSIGLSSGSYMYAGTRGRSGSGIGSVLKCTNPRSTPMTWTALANTSAADIPFGFQVPFWADAAYNYSTWDQYAVNKIMTDVRAIVLDPNDPNTIYVGLCGVNFPQKIGLWRMNANGTWQHLSANELFVGMQVPRLAIKGRDTTTLVVGTSGQELYKVGWSVGEPPPNPEDPPEGGVELRILQTERRDAGLGVRFTLTRSGPVEMKVFDVRGRLVQRLALTEAPAGTNVLTWDGRDRNARRVVPGVYLARLKTEGAVATTKLLLAPRRLP